MADTGSTMGSTDTRRRRERYSGKFPRKFSLKYKELSNNNTIIERGAYLLCCYTHSHLLLTHIFQC